MEEDKYSLPLSDWIGFYKILKSAPARGNCCGTASLSPSGRMEKADGDRDREVPHGDALIHWIYVPMDHGMIVGQPHGQTDGLKKTVDCVQAGQLTLSLQGMVVLRNIQCFLRKISTSKITTVTNSKLNLDFGFPQ